MFSTPTRRRIVLAVFAAALGLAPPAAAAEAGYDPLKAVVGVHALVAPEARSSRNLGTERDGSGVVIDESGLILTIGYLLLEAHAIEVVAHDGKKSPASVVAYDFESGFGLVRATRPPAVKPARLGDSGALKAGDRVVALSRAGAQPLGTPARVVARRVFAGYWEYLLENAIFTAPPHLVFGGAGLFAEDGSLVGIGSLFVNDAAEPQAFSSGNMFVPIDDLKPILADLVAQGRRLHPPRPWLGLYSAEAHGRVIVTRVSDDSPAKRAGLKPGDVIVGIDGRTVRDLADLYRRAWAQGAAGAEVPLDVMRPGGPGNDEPRIERVVVRSIDRTQWLRVDKGL